jgi:hypothetical protein
MKSKVEIFWQEESLQNIDIDKIWTFSSHFLKTRLPPT